MSNLHSLIMHCVLEIERLNGEVLVALEDLLSGQGTYSSSVLSISNNSGMIESYCDVLVSLFRGDSSEK